MKIARVIILLLLLLVLDIGFASAQATPSAAAGSVPAAPHRPRVALALSGGGSVGMAHIGVLQYFEEHHIPVDAIAGSSMGGLVGGLYAVGYSPAEIERIMQQADWQGALRLQPGYSDLSSAERNLQAQAPADLTLKLGHRLTIPPGLSTAEPADLLLSRLVLAYSRVEDFSQLPTPFRCVATKLQTGEAVVLERGNLARALRATMSVPGIFTPIEWDGHALVDGGLVNNLPVDVARGMGADVVIGVHFDLPVPPEKQLRALNNVLMQSVSVAVALNEREALRNADLVLAPSLVGVGGLDASHARELVQRGYQASEQKSRFLATLALNDADWAEYLAERKRRMMPRMKPAPGESLMVQACAPDAALQRRMQNELDHSDQSLTQIEHALSTLAEDESLPATFYRLAPQSSLQPSPPQSAESVQAAPQRLIAEADARQGSQLFLRPALQFAVANGEPTRGTLLAFATILPEQSYNTRYRVQAALGYSPGIAAEYESSFSGGRWFWMPSLNLQRQNSATYSGSHQHFTHWQDNYTGAFDLGFTNEQHLRMSAGLEAGYVRTSAIQFPGALATGDGALLAPRLLLNWNTLDQPALPARGVLFTGAMMARYRQSDARWVPLAQGAFAEHLPVASGTLTGALRGGSSFGEHLNYFDLFALGGPNDLRGFRFEQFHVTSYATGELAYRRPFTGWKLFGERPQAGVWYDTAGVNQPLMRWQSEQSGSAGVMLNTPLGVITLAIARTSDGQTRGWISMGKP